MLEVEATHTLELVNASTGTNVIGGSVSISMLAGASGQFEHAALANPVALAAEYGGEGIRINAILPSVIDTPANRAAQPGADTARWVRPDEIAETVHFLCSAEAAPISGAHLPVYGRA